MPNLYVPPSPQFLRTPWDYTVWFQRLRLFMKGMSDVRIIDEAGTYNCRMDDYVIIVDEVAAVDAVVLKLPLASRCQGKMFVLGASTGGAIFSKVEATGGETVTGYPSTNLPLVTPSSPAYIIISNGVNWDGI